MNTELTKEDYLKAARVIKGCPRERLRLVVDVIRQSGIEISDEALESIFRNTGKDKEKLKEKRKHYIRDGWAYTKDPVILMMREAYDEGINFREICDITGLNKSTVYRMLNGVKTGSAYSRELIQKAIEQIRARDNTSGGESE